MLKITNIPQEEKLSELYDIKLNGIPAKANFARVSAMPFNCIWPDHQRVLEQTEEAAFLNFAMSEPVVMEVTAKKEFTEAVVRPLHDGVVPQINGKTVSFTIEKPGQYTLELDSWHNALHIFANPVCDYGVCPEDENVIYFPAGVHHPGVIELQSNQTLYIDKDAVVYGAVIAVQAENIKILGDGILDGSWEERNNQSILVPVDQLRRNPRWDIYSPILKGHPSIDPVYPVKGSKLLQDKEEFLAFLKKGNYLYSCIHIYECQNILIQGVTLRDASGFTVLPANCENLTIDNIKIVGNWRYNSDGVDFFNCRNSVLKNSFLRCFDDCVVLKGMPGWDTWSMENLLIENCVVWCDWGATLEIGAETCAPEYRNIIFRDCDCIHNTGAAMRVHHCDRAKVHNLIYDDIRAEYSKYDLGMTYQNSDDMVYEPYYHQPTFALACFDGETYFSNDKLKGSIDGVTYRNIKVYDDVGEKVPPIRFEGYNAEHTVSHVTIDGLYYNGQKITDESVISTNEFASDICLK